MSALKTGDRVADRYRVESLIARGGMGAVYLATDERLARSVALKVLLAELGEAPTALARFEREALAAARLSHPGIVQVFDFGRSSLAGRKDQLAFMVMEHVDGITLSAAIASGPLAPARAASLVEQVLDALETAHAAGIVHRDLKPANIMLIGTAEGRRERVKVLDFGVAQLKASEPYARLTRTGMIVGTPMFMAPEQTRGDTMDARTDVYAMGVVLWCCLTGQRPFDGSDMARLIDQVLMRVPERADHVVTDVPESLASLAAIAMEKRPEKRFPTAQAFAAALSDARARLPGGGDGPPIGVAVTQLPSVEATEATRPARRAVTRTEPDGAPLDPSTDRDPSAPTPSTPALDPTPISADGRRFEPQATRAMPQRPEPQRARVHSGATAPIAWEAPAAVARVPVLALEGPSLERSVLAPKRGPRLALLAVAMLLAITALAVVAVAVGVYGMSRALPPGVVPRMPPLPGIVPASGVCDHAMDCCRAYRERVNPGYPPCETVVGFAAGDDSTCTRQLTMFEDLSGGILVECL